MKPFFLAELEGSVAMFWRQLSLKQQLLPPTLFSEVSFSVIIKKQNLLFLHCQKNSEKTKPRGLCFFSHQISVNHGYLFQNVCNTIQHYYGPNLVFISGVFFGFFLLYAGCVFLEAWSTRMLEMSWSRGTFFSTLRSLRPFVWLLWKQQAVVYR